MGMALTTARSFIRAVQEKDADAAAELCTDDVEVLLPVVNVPFRGKDGVRQMVRMAPAELLQSVREEEEDGTQVRVRTLTRAPGVFANYTSWIFETDGQKIRHLTFELRAAN